MLCASGRVKPSERLYRGANGSPISQLCVRQSAELSRLGGRRTKERTNRCMSEQIEIACEIFGARSSSRESYECGVPVIRRRQLYASAQSIIQWTNRPVCMMWSAHTQSGAASLSLSRTLLLLSERLYASRACSADPLSQTDGRTNDSMNGYMNDGRRQVRLVDRHSHKCTRPASEQASKTAHSSLVRWRACAQRL